MRLRTQASCLKPQPYGMLMEMRDAVIWGGAVFVGIAAVRLVVPLAPVAAFVLTVAAPVAVLLVVRRLPVALLALSGVVVGAFGYWLKVVLESEAQCNVPRLPGRVVCSRFGGPIPSLTVTITLVAIGLAIGIAALWMTRARQRA